MVDAVCHDFEAAPIPEKDKALLRYVAVVNDAPAQTTQEHVDAAKEAGWSDHALFDALDGAGLPDVPRGFYEARLAEHGDMGYKM